MAPTCIIVRTFVSTAHVAQAIHSDAVVFVSAGTALSLWYLGLFASPSPSGRCCSCCYPHTPHHTPTTFLSVPLHHRMHFLEGLQHGFLFTFCRFSVDVLSILLNVTRCRVTFSQFSCTRDNKRIGPFLWLTSRSCLAVNAELQFVGSCQALWNNTEGIGTSAPNVGNAAPTALHNANVEFKTPIGQSAPYGQPAPY